MTTLLEKAVDEARHLPTEMQDEMARLMLLFAGHEQPAIELTPQEDEALARSDAAASQGEFASDEEVRAVWAKHGL
ncbi:MAG TPA: hypothetical protein VFC47_08815 [Caulobacteraceae bacterium]|nr:hypothetical protein [Caulobacteraceae bacterium]